MVNVSLLAVAEFAINDAEEFLIDRMQRSTRSLYMPDHVAMVYDALPEDLQEREYELDLNHLENYYLDEMICQYVLADKSARILVEDVPVADDFFRKVRSLLFPLTYSTWPRSLLLSPPTAGSLFSPWLHAEMPNLRNQLVFVMPAEYDD